MKLVADLGRSRKRLERILVERCLDSICEGRQRGLLALFVRRRGQRQDLRQRVNDAAFDGHC